MNTSLISMHQASVYRGTKSVLCNVSLEILPGCSTVILGPNGSGKSTLLKVFSRELYPASGNGGVVRLMGLERWNVWELRRQLGIVSSDLQEQVWERVSGANVVLSGFFSSLDIYDHQAVSAEQRTRSLEMMSRLGIAHLHNRPFGEMSTGEQRRTILARALIHEPRTLIFDEPTTGLDVQACAHYLEIIQRFIHQGGTVILVTHHVHEIPPEITRVICLKEGKVVQDGHKQEVLTSANLTALFDTPVYLLHRQGWFHMIPSRTDTGFAMTAGPPVEMDTGGWEGVQDD